MDTNLKGTWAFCKHFGIAAKKDLENDQVDPPEGGYSIVYVPASLSAVRDLIADASFQEYRNIGSNASLMGIEYTSIYVRSVARSLQSISDLTVEVSTERSALRNTQF